MWQAATGDESQFKWIKQSGPFNQFNVLASGNVPVAYVFKSPFCTDADDELSNQRRI